MYTRNSGYCDDCIVLVNVELPRTTPSGGRLPPEWIHCPNCGRDMNLRAMHPNNICNCGYRFNPTTCPQCHRTIDKNAHDCNHCGWINRAYVDTRVRTTKTMQKRISGKIYETVIFEIIGAFLVIGMPFIGFPPMSLLAVALMAFLPLYNFLPSENELLASRQRNVESLGGEATGLLVLKSMSKLFMFFFSVAQFVILPVSKLIPLGISFFYYFTLPVSYKTTQPFKMLEAWLRILVGILIAVFIYWGFLGSSQAMSLALMSVAFFCTSFPRHRNREAGEEGQVNIELISGGSRGTRFLRGEEGTYQDQILSIIFLIFMAGSLYFSGIGLLPNLTGFIIFFAIPISFFILLARGTVNHVIVVIIAMTVIGVVIWGMASADMITIIFLAVWELSVISGLAGGKESRPAMGILMIFMTLFVFSFTATGVMGTAVFGYWWPQIESTVEVAVAPIAPMWEQVQSGMGDAWLMLTNPMAYYDQMTKRSQATKSVVKEGGTTKSIELTKTDLFTSVTGELEPRLDPLIGSFEIQNQGEFDANKIMAEVWASWKNPTTLNETCTGDFKPNSYSCSLSDYKNIETLPNNCKELNCSWSSTTYPKEMKVINFVFNNNSWDLGADGNLVECNDCGSENETYKHGGQQVKVNVNLTYDYNVNVSIPVEVINRDKYINLLQARQITLQELTSQYTGGPVKATLWSQKQPVRGGELSLFVASIVNEGGGTLKQIYYFLIKIPTEIVNNSNGYQVDTISWTFDSCSNSSDFNYIYINCSYGKPMKTGEYKRVSFFVTPKESITDRRTGLITGLANYEYIKTGSASIAVANAPWD
jgi:hypothetical protein